MCADEPQPGVRHRNGEGASRLEHAKALVEKLNASDVHDGILVQSPLPAAMGADAERRVFEAVDPDGDRILVMGHPVVVEALAEILSGAGDLSLLIVVGTVLHRTVKRGVVSPGVGHELDDVDLTGSYDAFTFTTMLQLEDYGFCKKGEGGPFVQSGALRGISSLMRSKA